MGFFDTLARVFRAANRSKIVLPTAEQVVHIGWNMTTTRWLDTVFRLPSTEHLEYDQHTIVLGKLMEQALEGMPFTRLHKQGTALKPPKELMSALQRPEYQLRVVYDDSRKGIVAFVGEHGGLHMQWGDDVIVTAFSNDYDIVLGIEALLKQYIGVQASNGSVFALVPGYHGDNFRLQSLGKVGATVIRENYMPEIMNKFDHAVGDLLKDKPCGRIIIADGEPGTGKTYLVRAFVDVAPKATFVLVAPHMVKSFSDPEFIHFLIDERKKKTVAGPLILILEDADECLVPRAADNMSSITNILNMTDGLVAEALNVRIIATTNANRLDIDKAIVRPGRLCTWMHIDKLSTEQANAVHKRLFNSDGPYKKPVTLAEVYNGVHG